MPPWSGFFYIFLQPGIFKEQTSSDMNNHFRPAYDFAVVVPMANEEAEFEGFISVLAGTLDRIGSGRVYLVVDSVSLDRTLELCNELASKDPRFEVVWAEEDRNVVDAYMNGYRAAAGNGHEVIIEMDAGMSHDPRALPMFLRVLNEGNECAFGSRFINGGSIYNSNITRTFISRFGTTLSNLLLGTKLFDMTSGYQGFHLNIVREFIDYPMRSTGHFYQTELRYILRFKRYAEIPIHYRVPSPSISASSLRNSLSTLLYYFWKRITGHPVSIK
jgi:dolichol-phosphate mannosyltransferase